LVTSLYCRICGTRLPTDSSFCHTCGVSQTGTDQALTSLPQQEPVQIGTGRQSAGHLLHQRYRLLRAVGQGGMGAVYVAQDTQLGDRLVAVKEMSMSRLTSQEVPLAVEQFRREAHLLAGLHHPNLPVIHEYFSENDRWYLVMSFIEGQNLQAALDATPGHKFPLLEVVRIGMELCDVLEYLHTHTPQIIFRDLKPLNIMLTPKGHICLIDFGIARHFKQEQTKDTAYYYSVGYAPPEQYGQSQTSPLSDIYSLGATLHQMLSGHNPASKPFQFPNLQLVDPTIPVPLAKLITQMLEMNEQARPASVAEIKVQLEKILVSTPLSATVPVKSGQAESKGENGSEKTPLPPEPLPAPPQANQPAEPATLPATVIASSKPFPAPPTAQKANPPMLAPSPASIAPTQPASFHAAAIPDLLDAPTPTSYVLMYFRLSGIVLIISDIIFAAIGLLPYSLYTTPTFISSINLILGITILLFSLGLPALHMKQSYQTRWLGLSGVAALCTSSLLFAINYFLTSINPYQINYPLFYVANALQVIGSVLLGMAIIRASTFPRWTGVLLIVSGIIFIGSFMAASLPDIPLYIINNAATLLGCIAFIGCGYTLLRLK